MKPTKTNSFEMGLELKFLKNRIGLDFTYYSQLSKNQIMGMASSSTSGYGYRLINAGEIENKGVEIALNTRPIQTKDFSWDLNFNFSKNSNKVKKLVDDMDMFELEKATWLDVQVAAKVGENFGSIVGPDFQRNENGDILIDPQPIAYVRQEQPCAGKCILGLDRRCLYQLLLQEYFTFCRV